MATSTTTQEPRSGHYAPPGSLRPSMHCSQLLQDILLDPATKSLGLRVAPIIAAHQSLSDTGDIVPCQLTLTQLAQAMRAGRQTVLDGMKSLEEQGYLVTVRRFDKHGTTGADRYLTRPEPEGQKS